MKSFGGTPRGQRLERIKASPRWAGERFRNVHPIIPGLRDPNASMLGCRCGGSLNRWRFNIQANRCRIITSDSPAQGPQVDSTVPAAKRR